MLLNDSISKIKNALNNFNNENFKESSLNFLATLGYISKKELSFINSPNDLYYNLSQIENNIDKNKLLFNRWKKCYGLFQYTNEELTLFLSKKNLMLNNDYNQSYLFFAIELNGFFIKESELKTITYELNKYSTTSPIIILFECFGKIAITIPQRRKNKLNEEKDVIEQIITIIKPYKYANNNDAKLFNEISINNLLKTQPNTKSHIITEQSHKNNTNDLFNNIEHINTSKYNNFDLQEENKIYYQNIKNNIKNIIFWYLKEINKYNLLTKDDEIELAKHIINDGIVSNIHEEKIILSNLKLVYSIAKTYKTQLKHMELEDLIQEGNIGLMTAVEKFNFKKGAKFSTYATYWIKQSISRAIRNQNLIIRFPSYVHDKINNYIKLKQTYPQYPTKIYAKKLHCKIKDIFNLQDLIQQKWILSLDDYIIDNECMYNLNNISMGNKISIEEKIDVEFLHNDLNKILQQLTNREKDILYLRYLASETKTLEDIGQLFNVTRERIRQIEAKALDKLKLSHNKKILQQHFNPYIQINNTPKTNITINNKSKNNQKSCKKVPQNIELGNICNFYQLNNTEIPELTENGYHTVYSSDGIIGKCSKYNHDSSEIIISYNDNLCKNIYLTKKQSWISGNMIIIKPFTNNILKSYLFYILKNTNLSSIKINTNNVSNKETSLQSIKIPLIPLEKQKQFITYLNNENNKINEYKKQIQIHKNLINNYIKSL